MIVDALFPFSLKNFTISCKTDLLATISLNIFLSKKVFTGNSLAVWWLGLRIFTVAGRGSVPGWGTNIPQAVQLS